MNLRQTIYKVMPLIVVPGSVASIIIALIYLPPTKLDWQLLLIAFVTIFFSQKLTFQMPRSKIHFSVADVLILFTILDYGGGVSVFLALFESLFTSYSFRKKGITIKPKTFVLNAAIHTLSVFTTSVLINHFSPLSQVIVGDTNINSAIFLMLIMSFTQFFINSVLVAVFTSEKSGKTIWSVWNETFINLAVLYFAESLFAVLAFRFIGQINLLLLLVLCGLAAIVYLTYRRYINELMRTAELAEEAEHNRAESEKLRAEQAERFVDELKKSLQEQERISKELLESKNQFRHAAFHDNLTGLPNRNAVVDKISPLLNYDWANAEMKFAVLYLDLNSFKHINDRLGYSFGNQILKQVAVRLQDAAAENTIVARFGSDEFVVVTLESSLEDALALAQKIEAKITEPFQLNDRQVFTSPRIGIAPSNSSYETAEDMLRDAEIAMYQAKATHKSFVVFDRSMHDLMIERIELESDLRNAITRKEFCLYFQPIVDLETMQISGFEALVRWNHPQKGMVMPYKFIPLAEDTGLIIAMTEWILCEACQQVKKWQKEFNPELTISVNISGKHFSQSGLINLVEKVLAETGFTPHKLKLEITESAVMEDAEKAISILHKLKLLGVKLMIDDFGTGYSSLNYLHKFPVDTLKIDRSFVSSMENAKENNEIVKTIILMAKNLRLNVVAEGIETINQLHQLRKLDCENGQGFLFSRPMPSEQMENLLKNTNTWEEVIQIKNVFFHQERTEIHVVQ